jgi:RND family efflux transporter MFP subunit
MRIRQHSLLATIWLVAGCAAAAQPAQGVIEPLDCVINPSVVADLGSGVPGILNNVRVDRSDLVEAGDVVAELDSGVEEATLELAQARAEMDAEVELRRVNAAFGRRQHARSEDLFRRQAISTNDMDERETEARLARIQLRQAQDDKNIAQLELHRAAEVLKRRTIESPIKGVVMDRFKSVGEFVDDQPVVRVAQLDPLHVEVFVPVEHLGRVRPGMQARVSSEAVEGGTWKARVSRVDRVADVASGTYGVRLVLPNPDYRVPAGLRCLVQFVDQQDTPVAADAPLSGQADDGAVLVDDMPAPQQAPVAGGLPEDIHPASAVEVEQAAGQTAAALEPAAQLPLCLTAGPFGDRADAAHKADALRSIGLKVSVDKRIDLVDAGHKVVSTLLPNRRDALALVDRLSAAGIRDIYLPQGPNGAVRVALGLYKPKKLAAQRVAKLRGLGFDAQIVPWRERTATYFLAVRGVPSVEAQRLLADLPVPANDDAVARGRCSALASR